MVRNCNLPKALGDQFNDQFIKERLSYFYNGQHSYEVFRDNMTRTLYKHKIQDKGGNYAFIFVLSGSPLKGYALWNEKHNILLIIDAWLNIKKKYHGTFHRRTIEYIGDKELNFEFDYINRKYKERKRR